MSIKNENEVIAFVEGNQAAAIRGCSTMYKGSVCCIGPIKTICGPELMCHYDTIPDLKRLINSLTHRAN